MKPKLQLPQWMRPIRGVMAVLCLAIVPLAGAQTVWTGPDTNFTQVAGDSDVILPDAVALDRGQNGPLYNSITEEAPDGSTSPADTLWAFGMLSDYETLEYQTFAAIRNNASGDLGSVILNQSMVVHLINENIYLSLTFTDWGEHGAGGFAYTRSTAAVAAPSPTVSITNPAAGATFTAPASFSISASASVSSGTVTNVEFFAGAVSLGAVQNSPFTLTASGLAAGSYSLTAVASAAGVSATSAVVSITVKPPTPTVSISSPAANAVFAAPANIKITASASVSSGTVTNVSFSTNGTALGSTAISPFSLTASNLAANAYTLRAVATAAGISATSAPVSVTVVTPVAISNSLPVISSGHFTFHYTANPGLTYVIASSTNLVNWVPLATNVPGSSPVIFTDNSALTNRRFYDVILQPNP